jgi:hypothetical protein
MVGRIAARRAHEIGRTQLHARRLRDRARQRGSGASGIHRPAQTLDLVWAGLCRPAAFA